MRAKVLAFPGSLGEGLERALRLGSLPRPRRILVVGMGGSAIAGDLARDMWPKLLIGTLSVYRGGPSLGPLSSTDLVILSSYSGNTRETLSLARQIPKSCKTVVLSSGGILTRRAQKMNWKQVSLPPGWPPRAALGYGLGALAGILKNCGVVKTADHDIKKAALELSLCHQTKGPKSLARQALQIAKQLSGTLPHFFGVTGESAGPARRFANQLNENSKIPALWSELPEAAHNLVVGFQKQKNQKVKPVFLRLRGTKEGKLIDGMRRVLKSEGVQTIQIQGPLRGHISDTLWMVALGDLVSLDMANQKKVDPLPVKPIDRLKTIMSGRAKAPRRGV